jgi:hypothetical protein
VTAGERCDDGNAIDGDGCDADCTPTRVANAGPGLGVMGGGVAALLGGGALLAIGLPSWFEHEEATAAIAARRDQYAQDPTGSLRAIDGWRDQERAARDAWSSYGLFSVGAASALGALGLAGLAGGAWLALTFTEEAAAPAAVGAP